MGIGRREFLKLTAAGVAAAGLGAGCGRRGPRSRLGAVPRVLILGFDGLDPHLCTVWMQRGLLPNLARLAEQGGWTTLQSTTPPQSPVAWATFITGMDPSGHGIYDFIHRDPMAYGPTFSGTATHPASHVLHMGRWLLPLSKAGLRLQRRGPAFWKVLERHGVPSSILHIPSNFPPEESTARTLSGLGTPDIQGSYGHFSYFTTQPLKVQQDISGGTVYVVKVENGVVRGRLEGPDNPFRRPAKKATVDFAVYVDESRPLARIDIQGRRMLLRAGEWSDWVSLTFKLAPTAKMHGICRFLLRSTDPFKLYVSPINIDPRSPAMPVTTPADYGAELARAIGPFYTQGMAEDTKALSSGALTDEEFLDQAAFVLKEQKAAFEHELERFREGVLFGYFSGTDLVVHMFWRAVDPRSPLYSPDLAARHGDAIRRTYMERDAILGNALKVVGDDALVMVVSDHGFSPYRRSFDLNAWLIAKGYLKGGDGKEGDTLAETADWARSKAYGMGFNGLYINEMEREVEGVVSTGAAKDKLLDELCARLKEVRDPANGERVVRAVRKTADCYATDGQPDRMPDAVVGFERGYRLSWESALGTVNREWVSDNRGKWSGDHCMDPEVVPGVIFCNRPIRAKRPGLQDIAPTVLAEYGVAAPENMVGKPVL
jgi:predicted AlkP superfamily phosphohydrolase/phosphomutase